MPTFNTTDPKPGYVYDSSNDTWYPLVGIAPASQVDRWTKTAAGGETSLSGNDDNAVSLSYTSGTEQVYLNGVLLVRGQDYTATNGTTITGLTALAASDVAEVVTFNPSNILTTDSILDTDFAAKGDLISASAASTPLRVPVGTNGQVLKANSATTSGLEWGTVDADITEVVAGTGLSGGGTSGSVTLTNTVATTLDAAGDIIYASAADTPARLAIGAAGRVLKVNSGATAPEWAVDPTTDVVTTAGDLIYGTGADAVTRLGIGTASQVLAVNSGATAPEWITPSAGGMTLLGSGTLSSTGVDITSISSTYNQILVNVGNAYSTTGAYNLRFRVNGVSTAASYVSLGWTTGGSTQQNNSGTAWDFGGGFLIANGSANNRLACSLLLTNPNTTNANKVGIFNGFTADTTIFGPHTVVQNTLYNTAISSLSIQISGGAFGGGTYQVWGIK